MKRIFRIFMGAAMLAAVSAAAGAQESPEGPLWMRYSALSPDGSTSAHQLCIRLQTGMEP